MTRSRADRSVCSEWVFTVDRPMLAAIAVILAAGLVLSLAASPWAALRMDLPPYYFASRHLALAASAVVLMFAVSLLSPVGVRRLALGLFVLALIGLALIPWLGPERNGAQRWLVVAGQSLQPSEIMKPAFAVLTAWLLSEARARPDMPALALAAAMLAILSLLLLRQPDAGQTLLLAFLWGVLFFLSGQPLSRTLGLAGVGGAAVFFAAAAHDHVRQRLAGFLLPSPVEGSQAARAVRSFVEGGFLGRGPGEGTLKSALPDAHSDFIFAVTGEEYGVLACLALLGLFGFIVVRALLRAAREPDAANRLAISGLALAFGLETLVNMAVNTGLLPVKGLTLPLISAGGSSLVGIALTLGMLLALTRRRPRLVPLFTHPGDCAVGALGR